MFAVCAMTNLPALRKGGANGSRSVSPISRSIASTPMPGALVLPVIFLARWLWLGLNQHPPPRRQKPGREGLLSGWVFAMLALGSAIRIGIKISGAPANLTLGPASPVSPPAVWLLAGCILLVLLVRRITGKSEESE